MNPDDLVRLAHNIDLPFAAGKAPPSEFRIFAAGKVETTKGVFLFDAESAESVMADVADRGNEYSIDYDHGMLSAFAMDPAHSSRAAGWFKPELRSGELWATQVSWTPTATRMLADREYRYVSPAFPPPTDKQNRIKSLINVAITNIPATKRAPLLMTSRVGETRKEPIMKTVAQALSLAAEATEAEVLSAVTTLKSFASDVLSATGAKSLQEVHGILVSLKANEGRMLEQATKLAAFETREKEAAIATLIAEGEKVGKITPASKPLVLSLAQKHGIEALKGFLDAAQAAPKPIDDPAGNTTGVELTAQEKAYAEKHHIDLKAYAETKKLAIANGTYPG